MKKRKRISTRPSTPVEEDDDAEEEDGPSSDDELISAPLPPVVSKKARPTPVPKKPSPIIIVPPIKTPATRSKLSSPQKRSREEVESTPLNLSKLSVVEDREIDEEILPGVSGKVRRLDSSSFLTSHLTLPFPVLRTVLPRYQCRLCSALEEGQAAEDTDLLPEVSSRTSSLFVSRRGLESIRLADCLAFAGRGRTPRKRPDRDET